MRTYSGNNAGSEIEPVLARANESVWISSPWLGAKYAKQLASLSQRGVEVRIITSKVDYNTESLEIFKTSENPNLLLLVLDKDSREQKTDFVHSKIYLIDRKYGMMGSANLTYSGLHSNFETLDIAENIQEVQNMELGFTRIWMTLERKGMSKEELSSGTTHSIRSALPLLQDYGGIDGPSLGSKELVYHPYYFFEFSFRTSAGSSPPVLFEGHDFVILDGVNRQIVKDELLAQEINNAIAIKDYVLNTHNQYRLVTRPQVIGDFREARELALDYIRKANTRSYRQYYRNSYRDKIFTPYPGIIRFIKSGFVQVPVWYLETCESDGSKHQDLVFGSSGRKWNELVYCADCQKKIWIDQAISCEICGRKVCNSCIKKKGTFFTKKVCSQCY
jgi:hypothetical protein